MSKKDGREERDSAGSIPRNGGADEGSEDMGRESFLRACVRACAQGRA